MNFTLCIPTYNSEEKLKLSLPKIKEQILSPNDFWIIDSSSKDNTKSLAESYGAKVLTIPQSDFNHGSTRNKFLSLSENPIYLFLTDDAIPAKPQAFSEILSCFEDEKVGMAYGRQIPHAGASIFASHARLFNYPEEGMKKTLQDAKFLGIKTCFCSNSFSAYRASALKEVGLFPSNTILSEDTFVAAKMLLNHWAVYYQASAVVNHSHNYSIWEEFKRYFDIGVFYGREKWIKESFGASGGEGMKFVRSELRYLLENKKANHLPEWFLRNAMKFLAYHLGGFEKHIPIYWKRKLSMHKGYWN